MEVSKYNQMMAYLTRPRERFENGGKSKYMTKGGRLSKGKLTLYNKYSQLFFKKDFKDLTDKESEKVENAARKGKFVKKSIRDLPTELNQEKIKKAFPDIKFDFKPGQKYGVPQYIGGTRKFGGTLNPEYTAIDKFVRRGFKQKFKGTKFQSLPKYKQQELINAFPDINFNFEKKGKVGDRISKYGISTNDPNYNRVARYFDDPKPFRFGFNLTDPAGWTLAQMDRATTYGANYEPILQNPKKPLSKNNKIIGMKDNTGKKTKIYTYDNILKTHPDSLEIQKYFNVAQQSRTPVSQYENVAKLLPEGFDPDKILLNDLLQFISDKRGVEGINRAKRAIEIHHVEGVGSRATKNFQLLRRDLNVLADTIGSQISKGNLDRSAELIEKGIRVETGGQKFGAKKLSPKGDFKQIVSGVEEALKDPKFDFDGLAKALAVVGCGVDRTKVQTGGTPTQACIKAGAEKINNPSLIKGGAEARNAAQFLNRAYKVGRGILKFGVIPEAIFVAGESLIRMGMGDTLNEAFLRSTDYLRPGNQTREADKLKFERTVGKETADIIMRAQDYKKSIEQLNTAKSNLETNQAVLDQSDFGYTGNVDALERQKLDEQIIKSAEQNVKNKYQSEAVMDFATMKEAEAKDISSSNSVFAKAINNARSAEVDDFEQLFVPEKKQEGVAAPMFTMDDIANIAVTDAQLQREKDKLGGAPEFTKRNLFNFNRQTNEDYNKAVLDLIFTEGRASLANRERLFGTQGTFGGQPITGGVSTPTNRFADFKLGMAGGGIAKLAGIDKGPQITSMNPDSGGLAFLKNNVKKL